MTNHDTHVPILLYPNTPVSAIYNQYQLHSHSRKWGFLTVYGECHTVVDRMHNGKDGTSPCDMTVECNKGLGAEIGYPEENVDGAS